MEASPESEIYPIDIHSVEKGHEYDVCKIMQHPPSSQSGRLELLMLRDLFQRKADEAGLCLSFRVRGSSIIRAMTDAEASRYHDRSAGNAVARLGRQVRRLAVSVDRSRLTADEQQTHDQSLGHRALQYFAARRPTKTLTTERGAALLRRIKEYRPNPFMKG
jgi:hypothetical protein